MNLEQDAKKLLMDRLDDCLSVHADTLDKTDIAGIYELKDLADLHYYLKAEHEFTPVEVEALLSFQDPLDVAHWCLEDNPHEHSFPICELLDKIDAYHRFEPVRQEPSPDRMLGLMKRLGQNWGTLRESWLSLDKETLIEKAAEIAAVQDVYAYVTQDMTFEKSEVEALLSLENPLKYLADRWPRPVSELIDMDDLLEEYIGDIPSSPEYLAQKDATTARESVHDRLQKAAQQAIRQERTAEKGRDCQTR